MANAEDLQRELDTLRRERREEDRRWRQDTSNQLKNISESQAETHSMVRGVKADVSGLRTAVHGTDKEPHTGLVMRVAELEGERKRQTWWRNVMIVSGLTGAADYIWQRITK